MRIIIETDGPPVYRSIVTVPDATAQHLTELQPVLAAASKRPGLMLADVVLMLVETQTGAAQTGEVRT